MLGGASQELVDVIQFAISEAPTARIVEFDDCAPWILWQPLRVSVLRPAVRFEILAVVRGRIGALLSSGVSTSFAGRLSASVHSMLGGQANACELRSS